MSKFDVKVVYFIICPHCSHEDKTPYQQNILFGETVRQECKNCKKEFWVKKTLFTHYHTDKTKENLLK